LSIRWRERKPDGGYTKRSEVIGPVSMLKTEANAWRAIEHRKLDVNSDHPQDSGHHRYAGEPIRRNRASRAAALDRQWIQVIPQSPDQTAVGRLPDFQVNPFAWSSGEGA